MSVTMCLAACSTVCWTGCCMGSQAERRLMKALAGCSNKEQIIISGHCPPPNSLQQTPLQHHHHPHLLTPLLKMLIGPITGRLRKGGVLGPGGTISTDLKEAWKMTKSSGRKAEWWGGELVVATVIPALVYKFNLYVFWDVASSYTPFASVPTNSLPPSRWLLPPSSFYLKILRQCLEDPVP